MMNENLARLETETRNPRTLELDTLPTPELVAALLEIPELVEARARRRKQHRVPAFRII